MVRDLLLAVGLPMALLVIGTQLLERRGERLPSRLGRLSEHSSLLWTIGTGLILALSLLRWLLQR
ncbi:hypothetical protein KBY88_05365 [Cyanobium sp. Morenito 9A2]|nr:hypothetical protein [Cyanobium sp. Morenito 9A2]